MPYKFDYKWTPTAIIMACQEVPYELYDLKRFGDVYRNRDLIELFDGTDVLKIDEITPRFVAMKDTDGHSAAFEAKRAGEVIRWAVDRGLAEQCFVDRQMAWGILDREMHYMAIGPERDQRVIRIRGLKDAGERAEATKLANRETKRRERARAKEIGRQRGAVARNLERIQQSSPEEPLPAALDRFKIEGHGLLRNYREVLIDAVAEEDGWKVVGAIAEAALDAVSAAHERRMADRNAAAESPIIPDDDADAMGDIGF